MVGPEGCNDGNENNGDGCSSVCAVEGGYTCSGMPSSCMSVCGDGQKKAAEGCDDGLWNDRNCNDSMPFVCEKVW